MTYLESWNLPDPVLQQFIFHALKPSRGWATPFKRKLHRLLSLVSRPHLASSVPSAEDLSEGQLFYRLEGAPIELEGLGLASATVSTTVLMLSGMGMNLPAGGCVWDIGANDGVPRMLLASRSEHM